jgi:hypothetical protein
MKIPVVGLIAVMLAGAVSSVAYAESASVASGVKSRVTRHWSYDARCQAAKLAVRLTTQPAHGRVSIQSERISVPANASRGGDQNTNCVGRSLLGVGVYYKSSPGYVGQDSFSYARMNPSNAQDRSNGEITYSVTVR